ncbi:hypothetical protein HYPSUDRAFT_50050 [Hypholoma sublateritium FD-334 SS-4]|uniref:Uncharacterized protein n=1 Tax=Hypholoma sublateritium (strain FD-334 SS-4) TaxID=945553 RepID=A0A0D2NWU4_HYPSF|nr:hypothetical protein HYPSUDRAFT_50050 [Hypholoma sublateritium FD-334 SS-4]
MAEVVVLSEDFTSDTTGPAVKPRGARRAASTGSSQDHVPDSNVRSPDDFGTAATLQAISKTTFSFDSTLEDLPITRTGTGIAPTECPLHGT